MKSNRRGFFGILAAAAAAAAAAAGPAITATLPESRPAELKLRRTAYDELFHAGKKTGDTITVRFPARFSFGESQPFEPGGIRVIV